MEDCTIDALKVLIFKWIDMLRSAGAVILHAYTFGIQRGLIILFLFLLYCLWILNTCANIYIHCPMLSVGMQDIPVVKDCCLVQVGQVSQTTILYLSRRNVPQKLSQGKFDTVKNDFDFCPTSPGVVIWRRVFGLDFVKILNVSSCPQAGGYYGHHYRSGVMCVECWPCSVNQTRYINICVKKQIGRWFLYHQCLSDVLTQIGSVMGYPDC